MSRITLSYFDKLLVKFKFSGRSGDFMYPNDSLYRNSLTVEIPEPKQLLLNFMHNYIFFAVMHKDRT